MAKANKKDAPFAVLSGGSLLVEAVGRTDLLGPERVDELTNSQFLTLYEFYRGLDEGVLLYPTHVHGSPCGAAIGDKLCSTIGYEFSHNELLKQPSEARFREMAVGNLPPKPSYYPRLKELNSDPPLPQALPAVPALPPKDFNIVLTEPDVVLVDTRHMLAFGGGHVTGAINLGASGHLSIQAGWMLDPGKRLLLVLESGSELPTVLKHFARTGFTQFAGYLAGGMSAWENAGYPIVQLRQMHVTELAALSTRTDGPVIVDVRAPQEWEKGHVPGARHIFLPELPSKVGTLRRDKPVVVYCDSGSRASIAASLLQGQGFEVSNLPGSWQAWTKSDLPVRRGGRDSESCLL